ncbi:hypothetical protein AAG570_009186 [Ranatra chinensis]|uniref:Microtubule-associated protein Jupiter n=1 Tax=Ranatra chinensis TaxID=642074 RepID=A0ABD0YT46_9HEMI
MRVVAMSPPVGNLRVRFLVLKPPGGGSSDIFGAGATPVNVTPRPRKNMQPSSNLFGESEGAQEVQIPVRQVQQNGSPVSKQAGNDSHSRLFGAPPSTPSATPSRNRMKSSIVFNESPNAATNGNANGNHGSTDEQNNKRSSDDSTGRWNGGGGGQVRGPSQTCARFLTPQRRNPLTGEGVDAAVVATVRTVKRRPDGNPVTGEGYAENGMNGGGSMSSSSSTTGSDNGNSSSGVTNGSAKGRARVPPGGYSSGFW